MNEGEKIDCSGDIFPTSKEDGMLSQKHHQRKSRAKVNRIQ